MKISRYKCRDVEEDYLEIHSFEKVVCFNIVEDDGNSCVTIPKESVVELIEDLKKLIE